MEKEVKVTIPEGYEIDREKSSFERIVFRKKGLTYKDVMEKLCPNDKLFYIADDGRIAYSEYCADCRLADPNNATSREQLEQILALNKLMNVATYLNDGWKAQHGKTKYLLWFNSSDRAIRVDTTQNVLYTTVYFQSADLARQAIEILGETEVKKAFGIFE